MHTTLRLPILSYSFTDTYLAVYVVFGAGGAVGSDLVGRLAKQQGAKIVASDMDQGDLESLGSSAEIMPANTEDEAAVRCITHMQSLASLQVLTWATNSDSLPRSIPLQLCAGQEHSG